MSVEYVRATQAITSTCRGRNMEEGSATFRSAGLNGSVEGGFMEVNFPGCGEDLTMSPMW